MRQPIVQTAILCVLGGLGACATGSSPVAVPAQGFAAPAAATAQAEQGYSAPERRLADCLATFPGYDYRTDQIPAGPGVTRRCPF
jgi:hypothetical protein